MRDQAAEHQKTVQEKEKAVTEHYHEQMKNYKEWQRTDREKSLKTSTRRKEERDKALGHHEQRDEQLCKVFSQRMQRRTLVAILVNWAWYADDRRIEKAALIEQMRWKKKSELSPAEQMQQALARAKQTLRLGKREKMIHHYFHGRVTHSILSRALARWLEHPAGAPRWSTLRLHALQRLRHRQMTQAFAAWVAVWSEPDIQPGPTPEPTVKLETVEVMKQALRELANEDSAVVANAVESTKKTGCRSRSWHTCTIYAHTFLLAVLGVMAAFAVLSLMVWPTASTSYPTCNDNQHDRNWAHPGGVCVSVTTVSPCECRSGYIWQASSSSGPNSRSLALPTPTPTTSSAASPSTPTVALTLIPTVAVAQSSTTLNLVAVRIPPAPMRANNLPLVAHTEVFSNLVLCVLCLRAAEPEPLPNCSADVAKALCIVPQLQH